MLMINQLTGFGVAGSSYAPGTVSASAAGSANSTTSGATLDVSFTGTAGRLLVVVCAADNNGTSGVHSFAGMTLASGGTGAATLLEDAYDPGAAAAGAGLAIYTIEQTVSGANTATVNFSPNTAAKAAIAFEVWHTGGAPVSAVGSVPTTSGTGTSPSATATGVLTADLLLAPLSIEARAAAGDAASWTRGTSVIADTTVAGTSMTLTPYTRTAVADGDHSWSPIITASRDYIGAIVTFRAAT